MERKGLPNLPGEKIVDQIQEKTKPISK